MLVRCYKFIAFFTLRVMSLYGRKSARMRDAQLFITVRYSITSNFSMSHRLKQIV